MRAAAMEAFGKITIREVDDPAIHDSDDVIVRIGGAGVCKTDLHTFHGGLEEAFGTPQMPYLLGHENAGWIEELGPGVEGLRPGDAVLLHPFLTCGLCSACRAGNDMHCTAGRLPGVDAVTWGGFGELMITKPRAIIRIPEGGSPVEFASYADAGITAYHAVRKLLSFVRPGDVVVVMGVGGLGQFGVQLCRMLLNAETIAVDISDDRLALGTELGADHVVNGRDGARAVNDVLELTGGVGARAVLDFVGEGDTPATSVKMLMKGGIYSIVGYGGSLTIDTLEATVRELTVIGNLVGTYNELVELVGFHARGLRAPHIEYRLEDAQKALEDLEEGRVLGRAVLVPS